MAFIATSVVLPRSTFTPSCSPIPPSNHRHVVPPATRFRATPTALANPFSFIADWFSSLFTTDAPPTPTPTPTPPVPESPPDSLGDILRENTYYAKRSSKYPYYLIQLSETEELPYKSRLVSDALIPLIRSYRPTHIIAQTHGWNTPPSKAIAIPFTEFIGGMQNDDAMPPPSNDFRPLFLAFIWASLPSDFALETDAETRLNLIAENERSFGPQGEQSDVLRAAEAAKKVVRGEEAEEEEEGEGVRVIREMAGKAEEKELEEEEDEEESSSQKVNRLRTEARNGVLMSFGRVAIGVGSTVLAPFEHILFGRLIARGVRTGKVMGSVLGKLMREGGEGTKVCVMGNSLGGQVLGGLLKKEVGLPYKIHTVFFVQGAVEKRKFRDGGVFGAVKDTVAGPVLCSYSNADRTLKLMFDFFRDTPLGITGFPGGKSIRMKSLEEGAKDPYEFEYGQWNSVDGSEYINEGDFLSGGHGDFKEDETTSLYWAAIKADVPNEAYKI